MSTLILTGGRLAVSISMPVRAPTVFKTVPRAASVNLPYYFI